MLLIWISGCPEQNSGAKTVKLFNPFWASSGILLSNFMWLGD
jgi:hypothetical protein